MRRLRPWQLMLLFLVALLLSIGSLLMSSPVTDDLLNRVRTLESIGLYQESCSTLLTALLPRQDCQRSEDQIMADVLPVFANHRNAQVRVLGLRSIGQILRLVGDLDSSEALFQASLETADRPQDVGRSFLALADTQRDRYAQTKELYARTHLEQQQSMVRDYGQQALELYQKAAEAFDGIPSAHLLAIQSHLRRLSLLLSFQDWLLSQNADTPAIDAQSIDAQIHTQLTVLRNSRLQELPPSPPKIFVLLDFAEDLVHLEADWLPEAITYAEIALSDAKALGDVRGQSHALGILGNLYEETEPLRSQQLTETALELAQSLQADDIAYHWHWQLGRLYHRQQQDDAAIAAYQAAVATLNHARQALLSTHPEDQFVFLGVAEQIHREATRLLLNQPGSLEQRQINMREALKTMDNLHLVHLENFLNAQLEESRLVALTDAIEPTESPDHGSVDPNSAVIRTVLFADGLELILSLPERPLRHYSVTEASLPDVVDVVERLQVELHEPDGAAEVRSLSAQLYEWLITPLAADLQQLDTLDTLVFILDDALQQIPMGVLYDQVSQQYLVEQYAIAITPGLELLDPKPLPRNNIKILAAGVTEPLQMGENLVFPALPNVERELQQVESIGSGGKVLLNQDFTQAKLHQAMQESVFSVVHIASHGQFSSNPNQTFIATYGDLIKGEEFRTLIHDSTQQHQKAIELLVLSACQSAAGDRRASLGLAGIAVGAGAHSTVATLWPVSDRSTASLMVQFYQTLIDQPMITKVRALRLAQLSLLQDTKFKDPYYWAPFVLIGNWL